MYCYLFTMYGTVYGYGTLCGTLSGYGAGTIQMQSSYKSSTSRESTEDSNWDQVEFT